MCRLFFFFLFLFLFLFFFFFFFVLLLFVFVFLVVEFGPRGQNPSPGGGIGTVGEDRDADVAPSPLSPPAAGEDDAELLLIIGLVFLVVFLVGRLGGLREHRSLSGHLGPARLHRARRWRLDSDAGLTRERLLHRCRPIPFPAFPVCLFIFAGVGAQTVVLLPAGAVALLGGIFGCIGIAHPGGRPFLGRPFLGGFVELPVQGILVVVHRLPRSYIVRTLVVVALESRCPVGGVPRWPFLDGLGELPVEGALVVVDLLPLAHDATRSLRLHVVRAFPVRGGAFPVRDGLQTPLLVSRSFLLLAHLSLQPFLLLDPRQLPRRALRVLPRELLRHREPRGDAFNILAQAKLPRRARGLLRRSVQISERLGHLRHLRGCRRDALPRSRGGRRGHGKGTGGHVRLRGLARLSRSISCLLPGVSLAETRSCRVWMNKSRGSEPRIGLGQVPDIAWPMVFRFRQRAFQLVLPLYLGCDVSTAIYLVCDQLYGRGERTKAMADEI